jgi:hypothetical protein
VEAGHTAAARSFPLCSVTPLIIICYRSHSYSFISSGHGP